MTLTKDLCEKNVPKLMNFEEYISKETKEKIHCKRGSRNKFLKSPYLDNRFQQVTKI
jgi:hypothetical protein